MASPLADTATKKGGAHNASQFRIGDVTVNRTKQETQSPTVISTVCRVPSRMVSLGVMGPPVRDHIGRERPRRASAGLFVAGVSAFVASWSDLPLDRAAPSHRA